MHLNVCCVNQDQSAQWHASSTPVLTRQCTV